MAAAGDAARCPEVPSRCHHCAGPLSKDMAPPVIVFSSACAGLAGGTIPAAAQLVSSSYHAAMSSSSFARSSSRATMPSQSFARSASHDDMHKARSSSPL
ncbi:hypothetical protein BAE44_0001475 [Dichanthelium oligosanthes]|uniref:Uncharacterized protein n=1 Tax=Dichanthelium oligosanthes TaxID=888268 RepID=A0A1E5WJC5_9POAL|nr:hypothetical protein BAE44_0001475 [Dichanthelium oligosanthes]